MTEISDTILNKYIKPFSYTIGSFISISDILKPMNDTTRNFSSLIVSPISNQRKYWEF